MPSSTIESLVKDKAAGFTAGSNAMYEPVKRGRCVFYNTEVCQLGSKMPVTGYGDTKSDFDKKWREYIRKDGWLVM